MNASWLWARSDLRRRWRAAAVLTVLTAVAGGFTVTALLGARRTATAWERFRTETLADDAFVSIPSRPDPEVADELAEMPGVIDATSFVYVAVTLPGVPEGGGFAAADDRLLRTVQRGRLIEGRRPNPSRAEEIVINETMASEAGVRAGQRVTLEAAGPRRFSKEVTVVGVMLSTNDLALNVGSPSLFLTPAFFRAHGGDVDTGRVNQFVRLEGGQRGVPAFRERVVDRYGADGGALVGDSNEEAGGIKNALSLQATAMALLAAVAAAATVVAVGQALTRHISEVAGEGRILRALGMTTGERRWGSLSTVAVVAIAGAGLAIGVAVAASPLVPTGLARQVEPDSGLKLDPMVMGLGGIVLAALVAGAGYLGSWRTGRTDEIDTSAGPARALRLPMGAAATVGIAVALGVGRSRLKGPARSAIAAGFVGVLGVTAAATFATSLDHLVATPRLYGSNYDAVVGAGGDDPSAIDDAIAGLTSDPDVTRVSDHELEFVAIGDRTVETFVLHRRRGTVILPTLSAGRAPEGDDEIILGPATMAGLGVRLGDRVKVDGRDGPVPLTVVGEAIFPVLGDGTTTEAAAIAAEAASALRLEESRGRLVMIQVRPGADAVAVAGRHTDLPVSPPVPTSEIKNLRSVGSAPWLLAAFLAALAAAAVAHAVMVSVRARRHDLAVLRALGFVRSQVRATVQWQASAMTALALVAGVPVGVAAGRWIWRLAVQDTGVLVEPVTGALLLGALVPFALLLANLAALIPARGAARLRPAEVLRTE